MSVSRRADGRWCVKFKTQGAWKQKTFKTESLARAFEGELLYEIQQNKRLTVLDAVVLYLRNHALARHTACEYARLVRPGIHGRKDGYACFLSSKFIDEVDRRDLENLRGAMRDAGLSSATINLNVGRLSTAFTYAAEEDLIEKNPWSKYKNLPAQHRSRAAEVPAELGSVYNALPDWAQWACRTTVALCLRPGQSELFSLCWTAFNWRTGAVTVPMSKTKRVKVVFPPQWFLGEALVRYRAATSSSEHVCLGRGGRRVKYTAFRSAWERACRRLGLHIAPYALRHFAATSMLTAGQDLQSVAAQLGHRDVTTTAKFYLHPVEEAQRRAGAALPSPELLVRLGAEKS